MSPVAMAPAKASRSGGVMSLSCSCAELALERLGIDSQARTNVLGDVADEDVLEALLQGPHGGASERRRRDLGRRHCLVPFGLEGTKEDIHHLHAARTQLGTHRLRS